MYGSVFFFQAEDGIRDLVRSRGLGDVYKRQALLYWPLLFTNRVLATGDILLYFYPYRDFVAEALRSGRIPFWLSLIHI